MWEGFICPWSACADLSVGGSDGDGGDRVCVSISDKHALA